MEQVSMILHTIFFEDFINFSFPNLAWKGELYKVPSGYFTTIISMHPLSVAYHNKFMYHN